MKENYKKRLYTVQEILSPPRAKRLSECTDDELVGIIIAGCDVTGKDNEPLTVQDLTDEKLMKIIMEGKRNERVYKEAL